MKGGPSAQLRLDPDSSAMTSYDFFTDGQPDSCPRVVPAVQPFENAEYFFGILRFNPDAIVRDGKKPVAAA